MINNILYYIRVRKCKIVLFTDSNVLINIEEIIAYWHKDIIVIIRDYHLDNRKDYAYQVANVCRKYHVAFLIANDVHLAYSLNASGVHLPEYNAQQSLMYRKRFPNKIISTSVHSVRQAHKIRKMPIDFCFISPVFNSGNKKGKGTLLIRNIISHSTIKVYLLGGINNKNIALINKIESLGIAGISLFDYRTAK